MSTPAWESRLPLGVDAHVHAGTELTWTVYPADKRITFTLEGTNSAHLTLYLRRADLARFHEAVSTALADLDRAIATDAA